MLVWFWVATNWPMLLSWANCNFKPQTEVDKSGVVKFFSTTRNFLLLCSAILIVLFKYFSNWSCQYGWRRHEKRFECNSVWVLEIVGMQSPLYGSIAYIAPSICQPSLVPFRRFLIAEAATSCGAFLWRCCLFWTFSLLETGNLVLCYKSLSFVPVE